MPERKHYDHESGTALDANDDIYDVTQWRKDQEQKLSDIFTLLSNRVTTEDIAHTKTHEGKAFQAYHNEASLANGSEANIYMMTPSGSSRIHMVYNVYGSAAFDFELLESPTVTSGTGTHNQSVFNKNRSSSTSSGISSNAATPESGKFSIDVTTTNDGTKVAIEFLGAHKAVADYSAAREIVLKASTAYVFRVTSRDNLNRVHINLDWYEDQIN